MKGWPTGRDAQRCRAVPCQASTPRPSVLVGLQEGCPHRGFVVCAAPENARRNGEALLRGQVRLPFRWGQRAGAALSGELAAGLLSPSSASCVSSESMISQAPEQLDAGGSLLLP